MMLLGLCFFLGIANVAMHRAVMESGHPMLAAPAASYRLGGVRLMFVLECAILVAAMLAVGSGQAGWAWLYLAYTLFNAGSAWLILTGRI